MGWVGGKWESGGPPRSIPSGWGLAQREGSGCDRIPGETLDSRSPVSEYKIGHKNPASKMEEPETKGDILLSRLLNFPRWWWYWGGTGVQPTSSDTRGPRGLSGLSSLQFSASLDSWNEQVAK